MLGQLTIDFIDIMHQASEGKGLTELMERLDAQLTYGGARRISEFEAELLNQLDESYDAQIKMQRDLGAAQRGTKTAQEKVKKMNDAIGQYCSETTRNKILLSIGWQFMPEKARQIEGALSDKEIVEQKRQIEGYALSAETIGKATISVSTDKKDETQQQIARDEQPLQEVTEEKSGK